MTGDATRERLAFRLSPPGTAAAPAAAVPLRAADPDPGPVPAGRAAAGKDDGDLPDRSSLYLLRKHREMLNDIVSDLYHDARGAVPRHLAHAALLRVIRSRWDLIQAEVMAEIQRDLAGQERE